MASESCVENKHSSHNASTSGLSENIWAWLDKCYKYDKAEMDETSRHHLHDACAIELNEWKQHKERDYGDVLLNGV